MRSPTSTLQPEPLTILSRANALLRDGLGAEAAVLYEQLLADGILPPEPLRASLELARARGDGPAQARRAAPRHGARPVGDDAFAFAEQSLARHLAAHPLKLPTQVPKVSVVMTCFNAADTLRESVESLLFQTYPNLEVIVCDDHSSDDSWRLLCEMQQRCSGLKVLRNNGNFGTYLSKNRAIDVAEGEIVMFQDSDDISHPARVSVQVAPLLAEPSLMATRTKYLRYDEATGRIVRVAGLASKFGLITLAVRRRAFAEIGFFDAVRRAGDDEWVQRLTHLFSETALRNVDVTLYLARLREGSLVADMLRFSADGQQVDQGSSPARRSYVRQFSARFQEQRGKSWYRDRFPPFPLRAAARYAETIDSLAPVAPRVHASLCSIPDRLDTLRGTIRSLEHQVDAIHLYLDKYDSVPEDLQQHPKVRIRRSQDEKADHRDNGKFLPFDALKASGDPFYFFTCDDDIVYPHDYVHTLVGALRAHDHRVVAGVHGVIIEEQPRAYFRRRFGYHFALDGLDTPRLVNNLGTGTAAFHSDLFDAVDPGAWPRGGMVDIYFSLLCRRREVPMLCLPRHPGWLVEAEPAKTTPSLFSEFHEKEALITEALRSVKPWGFQGIEQAVARQPPDLQARLRKALPPFHRDIAVSTSFSRLR